MPNVYKTTDNQNFVSVGNAPDQIKQLIWQGLPGKYIGVTTNGLLTTIDYGATWGYIYPNTEFATALPGGAVGYQTAFAIGPRGGESCQPIGSGCTVFPVTFAAWNNTGGAAPNFDGFVLQSEENNIAGIQTLADAFQGSDQDFLSYVTSGSSANSAIGGTSNLSWFEDGRIVTVIVTVVSRISIDYPAIPTLTHAEMSNWNIIETITFGDNSRLSVFSARWDDTSLLPLTIDCGAVQEAITFSVRVLTGAYVANPVIASRSAQGVSQGDTTFNIGIQFSDPYTDDNHTWIPDDIDGGAGEGASAGSAAIALEIQRCPSDNDFILSFALLDRNALIDGFDGMDGVPGLGTFGEIENTDSEGLSLMTGFRWSAGWFGSVAVGFDFTYTDQYVSNLTSDHEDAQSGGSINPSITSDMTHIFVAIGNKGPDPDPISITDTHGLDWQEIKAEFQDDIWLTVYGAAVTPESLVAGGTTITYDCNTIQDFIVIQAIGYRNTSYLGEPAQVDGAPTADSPMVDFAEGKTNTGDDLDIFGGTLPWGDPDPHDHQWNFNSQGEEMDAAVGIALWLR